MRESAEHLGLIAASLQMEEEDAGEEQPIAGLGELQEAGRLLVLARSFLHIDQEGET